jgi:hypothetical protein
MDTLAPLINLLTLLAALSIAAERATNVIKLNRESMREKGAKEDEKVREKRITQVSIGVAIVLAILLKADFFSILTHIDEPWATLGWARPFGGELVLDTALSSFPKFLYAVGGSVVTGFSLGFGSKFWHDMLDIVLRTRERLQVVR